MSDIIRKRSEVPEELTWNLKDLFESDEAWEREYLDILTLPEKISAFSGKLSKSSADLLAFYQLDDEVSLRISRLRSYASMKGDEDTGNSQYQDMSGKARGAIVTVSSASAFSDSEIMAIPEADLQRFFDECPELSVYKRSIEKIRKKAAHILSPAEEKILAAAGEMAQAPNTIGGMLRNADLKWPSMEDAEGRMHPLSNGSLTALLESTDPAFRMKVFKAYYSRLSEVRNTIAATLDGQFKQLTFFAKTRNYASTLDAALDRTEVPTAVYHNLIKAVHDNMDKMYHYVKLRKKLLGCEELHMSDAYAPMVQSVSSELTFEEAKATALKALSILGDDYTSILKEGFDNRWIDVYENQGKRSGAYSNGALPHPYVLLNFNNNLASQFTLVHEMGHSLHSYLSTHSQPVSTSRYVIFVAEVASTTNEVLLNHYLLKNTTDKAERANLINNFLERFKATLFRQTMFAEFELFMGQMAESGRVLTADALCRKYLELNKLYYGPDMISDDEIALEWARIPHFFMNYYVFQYATGFSAAVAIANRIIKEGAPAVSDYKKFLSSGSSMDPIGLLKIAGVDMSSPEPVNTALQYFEELVNELEELTE